MELRSVAPLRRGQPETTSAGSPARPSRGLSRVKPAAQRRPPRILDFDVESVAAGYGDPNWVPSKITCVAWSWVGSDVVHSRICGPMGLYYNPERRAKMLVPLLRAISEADILTGHNIRKFDLPVINSECMRLHKFGLAPIRSAKVHDTMRITRALGLKKGQDNLGRLLQVLEEKQTKDWQMWEEAYQEVGWPRVRDRCVGDVIQHKQIRQELMGHHWLKSPTRWTA